MYLWSDRFWHGIVLTARLWHEEAGVARVVGEDADRERCLALLHSRGERRAGSWPVGGEREKRAGEVNDIRRKIVLPGAPVLQAGDTNEEVADIGPRLSIPPRHTGIRGRALRGDALQGQVNFSCEKNITHFCRGDYG